MRILVTGKGGKSGSWAVRGEQLGTAIGATVKPFATAEDCRAADLVIVVKRTPPQIIRAITRAARSWVWDMVDPWPQPAGNAWPRAQAVQWLRHQIDMLAPTGVIFGTRRMQEDAAFAGPSMVLPHHAWPKYRPVNVRQSVESVGYEGDERYLGRWRKVVQAECDRRGWRFVVNGDLSRCDIGVALRDVSGYPSKAWKPGTKLSNLQALGLPAVLSDECGYREQANGTEFWVSHPDHVTRAFNELACPDIRQAISDVQNPPRLEHVASELKWWTRTLL